MTKTTAALILAFVVALVLWALFTCGPVLSAGYEPEPTATVAPTPPPAPLATVMAALRWERRCHSCLDRWNRARACFGFSSRPWSSVRPERKASALEWRKAGRLWRLRAVDYQHRVDRLVWRMEHPGGSGWERWRTLVRYTWPARCVNTVVQIIRYESRGNPRILCGGYVLPKSAGDGQPDSRAGGLTQCKPAPRGWANPLRNLRYAYRCKYLPSLRQYGNGWRPWAGCRAFQ